MGSIRHKPVGSRLPKSILDDPVLNRGIAGAWDIGFHGTKLTAKTVVFETRAAMRKFHRELFQRGITNDGSISIHTMGMVCKMVSEVINPETMAFKCWEVDPNYICIVLLVEGYMDIEVISHEAMHVGFAFDLRKEPSNPYYEPGEDSDEERVCYPAGIWLRQLAKIMSMEGIRATGGDSTRERREWKRGDHKGYLGRIIRNLR